MCTGSTVLEQLVKFTEFASNKWFSIGCVEARETNREGQEGRRKVGGERREGQERGERGKRSRWRREGERRVGA